MTRTQDEKLYKIWDTRWQNSEGSEHLTVIGRMIFKEKEKILSDAIGGIRIKNMIEVGCGLGHTTRVFHKAGLDYIGIDVSGHAVKTCQKQGLRVKAEKLEDVSDQYDLVFSDGMLEHFLNFEPYAQHMMRISRQYVLLIQPNHVSFCGKTLAYMAEIFRSKENIFEYNYRIEDFIVSFEKNGFRIMKNVPIFFDVFRMLLFEKAGST